ncbi:sterol desaturase family protein [Stappia indica]|uniref:Sterol desaturase/sphingolipid hydroxylase, fatty acid hydroxylase superfamily n=1 Tax=Stappia indica TaxID=538381 RepID=A0A285SQA9_9HYPH|nr:Sterol desaturase/sphingolipid hydroxylase, fatty acid hydroxylase superfamily [Stappia indica]
MSEATVRLLLFLGIFAAMALFELALPRRALIFSRARRWTTNLAIVATDTAVLRIVFPMAAVGIALWAGERGIGLFPALGMPLWLAGVLGFVLLDFAVWAEHWASHKIPLLWRIHRMHHADRDIDVTTALRFHPLEIVLSMVWKAAVVVAFGIPVMAVLVFEVVLNGAAMFNHANVRLPLTLDRWLRLLVVTPDMHRVHHSVIRRETDSNYGFNLAIWDRLFGTYVAQPAKGHEGMTIGLDEYQHEGPTGYVWSLGVPFMRMHPQSGMRGEDAGDPQRPASDAAE